MDFVEKLTALYTQTFGTALDSITELKAHGSNRRYFRLISKNHRVIGVGNDDHAENLAFLEFSRHFRRHGLPVPEILAENRDDGTYLEEDLGNLTLFTHLVAEREQRGFSDDLMMIYRKVVRILPQFQIVAGRSLDYSVCYPRGHFDGQSMMWDLNYFKYYFLKLANIPYNEQSLEDDFERFVNFLLQADQYFFLYRDFQSRNIMLREGEPWFIDYQGGRRGALQYDVASLLFDAKADLPFDAREALLNDYMAAVARLVQFDQQRFLAHYFGYVLIRIMQAMGAYGFRGFYERKTHFLQSVPFAVRNLEYVLRTAHLPVELPTLTAIWQRLVQSTMLRELGNVKLRLTVRLESFSYKNGLPKDEAGHGGGFIFDCRALPNPGRHAEFQQLTGNDAEVIAFLESRQEVRSFLTHVQDIISQSVENYQQRNFSDLSVAFGCTGGQHRSVYCANQLASFLKSKYENIKVEVNHREAASWPVAT